MQPRAATRHGGGVWLLGSPRLLTLAACVADALAAVSLRCVTTADTKVRATVGPNRHGTDTLASTFVFGSGEECPDEPYCLPALLATYGLTFGSFVVTDPGGPVTVEALTSGRIDVGVLFTTDPHISSEDLVLLEDDRRAQPAENVTPIVRDDLLAAHGPELRHRIDAVSARLTTTVLVDLNRRVEIDGAEAGAVAPSFLVEVGLQPAPAMATTSGGPTIIVGSANFSESATLAELYAVALAASGFPVGRRADIGNREAYYPVLSDGGVGLVPDYAGSLLGYLDGDASASSDVTVAHDALRAVMAGSGLTPCTPARAATTNGIVVARATATRHRLATVSDLGRPVGRRAAGGESGVATP